MWLSEIKRCAFHRGDLSGGDHVAVNGCHVVSGGHLQDVSQDGSTAMAVEVEVAVLGDVDWAARTGQGGPHERLW